MDDTFKKFFGGTLGIVLGISVLFILICLCCLILAVIGQANTPQ